MNKDLGFGPQFRNSTLESEPSKALIKEELREEKESERAAIEEAAKAIGSKRLRNAWVCS